MVKVIKLGFSVLPLLVLGATLTAPVVEPALEHLTHVVVFVSCSVYLLSLPLFQHVTTFLEPTCRRARP